jgi:1-acyl-sn-glycerol-3-phosphate acyltransferase
MALTRGHRDGGGAGAQASGVPGTVGTWRSPQATKGTAGKDWARLKGRSRDRGEGAADLAARVHPLVAALLYPLAKYVVLPRYFRSLRVVGAHHLPTAGPVILAPTHRSRWDGILMCFVAGRYATGRDLRFMVTANEMAGLQGWLLRRIGCFAIDPDRPSIAGVRRGVQLLEAGEALTVFPEGDIFRDGAVHPLKGGLARMAIAAELRQPDLGVQVVPIAFHYDDPTVGKGSAMEAVIGKPLPVRAYLDAPEGGEPGRRDRKAAAAHLMKDLAAALVSLNDRPSASQPQTHPVA